MPSNASFTIEDYSHETSVTSINVQDITTLNYGDVSTAVSEIQAELVDITLGELRRTNLNKTYAVSAAAVTDQNAQREQKWLVTYRDVLPFLDAGSLVSNPGYLKTFTFEVACPDLSLLVEGTDRANLASGPMADFVAAFEEHGRSPYNSYSVIVAGPFVEVIDVHVVGRNL